MAYTLHLSLYGREKKQTRLNPIRMHIPNLLYLSLKTQETIQEYFNERGINARDVPLAIAYHELVALSINVCSMTL